MAKRPFENWLLRVVLLVIVYALIGGGISCVSPNSSNSSISLEELYLIEVEGEIQAPDFTIPTMEGGEITLSHLRGKPAVLNLWAIRCPPCKVELPYFDAVAKQNKNKVTIIAVNIEDSISDVRKFFGDSKVSFIVAIDVNAQVARIYAPRFIPTTIFIDSEGIIRYFKVGGFANEEHLQACVTKIVGES
jgi:thiol-disulfide isomerase/thioredoxin